MNIILLGLMLIIGITASVSDIKQRKIYNRHLVVAISLGIIIFVVQYSITDYQYVFESIINIGLSLIIGFVFYYFKIWAAGDAKLFSVMIFLTPYEIYQTNKYNIFPAFGVLSMVFSLAFLYICVETFYFKMNHMMEEEQKENFVLSKDKIKIFIVNYLIGYNAILVLDHLISSLLPDIYTESQGLIWLIHIFLIMYLSSHLVEKKKKIIFLGTTIIMNIVYSIYTKNWVGGVIDIRYLLLAFFILWVRNSASQYNYETIPTEKVKEGVVLSYGTIIKFTASRIKGLPKITDETTKYRISNEEAEAVKRWQHSKYGDNHLVIVRHLPFAPFILFGTCTFIAIKYFIGR